MIKWLGYPLRICNLAGQPYDDRVDINGHDGQKDLKKLKIKPHNQG